MQSLDDGAAACVADIIRAVKRSPTYRSLHSRLLAREPLDAWVGEASDGYVAFLVAPEREEERGDRADILVFAVDAVVRAVVSASLARIDENGTVTATSTWSERDGSSASALPL